MDKITAFGTAFGMLALIVGVKLGGGSILSFFDIPSMILVFGGSFGGMCIAYSWPRVNMIFGGVKLAYLAPKEFDYLKLISNILSISEIARKEGILALDTRIAEIEEPMLQRGLQMVVDGIDVNLIREVLDNEIESAADRHADIKSSIDFFASVAPAFGLIGTILGLIGLLRNMDDPSAIGPSMALALVTTLYGAIFANMFMMPFGKKLEERSNDEKLFGQIIAKGCLMISAGVHPRIIQERLLSYLSASNRAKFVELHLSEELKKGGEK
ncbi:MAG: Flagellar motor rotation protein MotA [Candidatus Ozemobacter sibiricus]|uniref:Flagellar motor rotation protein MotA n=1 Tax=Candidatus Ozemobacter sibiricus TaxID=2268124 RepID=A0A367ZQ21_9BACT|nr:MAG: Flagellar motor rotation protein MotA [Candidatus Ozemobacter sibiricus]